MDSPKEPQPAPLEFQFIPSETFHLSVNDRPVAPWLARLLRPILGPLFRWLAERQARQWRESHGDTNEPHNRDMN